MSSETPHDQPLLETLQLVDYAKTLDCIHCGLCLQTCPTYRLSGVESSSPRGRIHLMRAVGEERLEPDASYDEELDYCLLCRHCESVCPAGVPFGQMMETARHASAERRRRPFLARLALNHVLPKRFLLRLAGSLLRMAQLLRMEGIAARLSRTDPEGLRKLPRVPALPGRPLLASTNPAMQDPTGANEERNGTAPGDLVDRADLADRAAPTQVVMLQGCVQAELFAHVNRATLRSLQLLGCGVAVPSELVCCGSLHAHNGDREGARMLAKRAVEALEALRDEAGRRLPLVVNSAGCGSHLKELHELFPAEDPWHARAREVAESVQDYAVFVARRTAALQGADRADDEGRGEVGARPLLPRLPDDLLPTPVTWDDPCHLCHGQGVRDEPRTLLRSLLGDDYVELDDAEACCGSAGVYSLARPADAQRVFSTKREAFERSGARTLVTANPGCQLQWSAGLEGESTRVVHLAELVEAALASARAGKAPE